MQKLIKSRLRLEYLKVRMELSIHLLIRKLRSSCKNNNRCSKTCMEYWRMQGTNLKTNLMKLCTVSRIRIGVTNVYTLNEIVSIVIPLLPTIFARHHIPTHYLSGSCLLSMYLGFSFSSHLVVLVEVARVDEVGSLRKVSFDGEGHVSASRRRDRYRRGGY